MMSLESAIDAKPQQDKQTRNAVESAIELAKGYLVGTWEKNLIENSPSIEKWEFLVRTDFIETTQCPNSLPPGT